MTRWIFYHAQCLDGFGAALAAWRKYGYSEAVYRACRYDEGEDPFDMCEPDDEVFVLDFSFKRDILLRQSKRLKIFVLDHHKIAEADLSGLDFCKFNSAKSGAVLAWEHFHPGTAVPKLMRHIQDHDLWKFEMLETREIIAALASMAMNFEVWKEHLDDTSALAEIGNIQIGVIKEEVQKICARAGWLEIQGHVVPAVNSPIHQSEIGHELLAIYPEVPFAAVFYDFQKDIGGAPAWVRVYSLRAESDYDVGELAKSFGGGGHKSAAGFTVRLSGEIHGHPDIVSVHKR